MKKKLFIYLFAGISCMIMLPSCYNTRILVGSVEPKTPLTKVNKEWNHGFIYGLVPVGNATMKTKEYVGDRDNYVVKTNIGFVHGLVGCLTFGIYTPTQTTYYIPLTEK